MALLVQKAGLATSIQGGGRVSVQHLGVPFCGAADLLSLALANYLVSKESDAPALEFTLGGATIVFKTRLAFALAGAFSRCSLNAKAVPLYEQIVAQAHDVLTISPLAVGARLYMAVSPSLKADCVLGSCSTYAPGRFGGFGGRMLRDGDVLEMSGSGFVPVPRSVEKKYRPMITRHIVVRAVAGAEINQLSHNSRHELFATPFVVSARNSRMGLELARPQLAIEEASLMKSSAVFPGLVQCPPSGKLFLLLCDAQTTGGYPRIAQVIRAGRHLLGQLRAGSSLRFVLCSQREAARILREKNRLYAQLFGKAIF